MRRYTILWAWFVRWVWSFIQPITDKIMWPIRTLYAVPAGSNIKRSRRLNFNIFMALLGLTIEDLMAGKGLVLYASKLNYSQAAMQAQLNGTTTTVGNAGTLNIYTGTQPSATTGGDGTANTGPFTLGSPFAPAASAAVPSVLSPTLPSNVNASASTQPTWFRVKTSGGTAVLDGSAGTSGCDMTIGPTTSGQPVAITSWTITSGNSGH